MTRNNSPRPRSWPFCWLVSAAVLLAGSTGVRHPLWEPLLTVTLVSEVRWLDREAIRQLRETRSDKFSASSSQQGWGKTSVRPTCFIGAVCVCSVAQGWYDLYGQQYLRTFLWHAFQSLSQSSVLGCVEQCMTTIQLVKCIQFIGSCFQVWLIMTSLIFNKTWTTCI